MKNKFLILLTLLTIVCNDAISQAVTFNYTGGVQNYTVPACVTQLNITAHGAEGGGADGGNGATVTGIIAVTPGQVLQIRVGGVGTITTGGYNGGGIGKPGSVGSGGGGGGTDIRVAPYATANRIVVAGGGGGTGGGSTNADGGSGGDPNGSVGSNSYGGGGGAGTTIGGGVGGAAWGACGSAGGNGVLVNGGAGGTDNCYGLGPGGGGGGGLYGGGGGGADDYPSFPLGGGGGGGGSSLIPGGGTGALGAHTGAGQVIINPIGGSAVITCTPPSSTICSGASVVLTAGGATTYTWAPGTGLSATTGTTVTASPTTTTTYTITGTTGTCSGTTTVTITVNPTPVVTCPPATMCAGAPAVPLTAGGASTYSWSPGTGLSATTGSTVMASPATTTTYTITGTSAAGCVGTTTSTVTVNALPIITCPPATICSGLTTPLTASGASTYSWSPGTGLSATTGATVTAGPASTTTYTITGTSAAGCSNTGTVTVTVNSTPIVTCPSATICNTFSTPLTASGASTYSWSPGTGLSATTGATVTASPSATTVYTITGTSGAGCVGTTTATVTVNPLPTVTCPSISICDGSGATLTASGASTYSWSPGTGLSATTGTSVTANPTATTTYTITGTSAAGCVNTGTTTVTVNPLPTVTCPNISICPGGTGTLTAAGASTYTWGPAGGLSATSGNPIAANPAVTTIYTVTGTSAAGCVNNTTVTVTVNSLAVVTVPDASICNGSSTLLTASGATTYTWSPGTGLSATTGVSVTANPTATITYTITGTTAAGCSGTTTSTVTVNPLPTITCAPATICNGASTPLTAAGGSTYAWSPGTGLSSTTGTTVTASPSTTITYTITGTDVNSCVNTTTTTVTVNPVPDVIATPPSETLCSGSTTGIALSSSVAGTTFAWTESMVNVTGASAGTGATIAQTITTTTPPSGTVTYTITPTATGCVGTPIDVIINMQDVTITSIAVTPALCFGSADGTITVTAPGATQYSSDGGTTFQPSNVFTVGANTYTIVADNGFGCQATGTAVITEPTLLVVPMSFSDENCFGSCDGIAGTAPSGGTSPYTYTWSSGSAVTPFISSLCTGSYTVTVTDFNGCIQTGTTSVNGPVAVTITSVVPSQPSCNGGADGSILINASATAVNFSIDGGATFSPTNTFTGLSAGTYSIEVQDAAGCSATSTTTITQPTAVAVTPGLNQTVCFGQSVTISATGNGGTAPYSYAWTDALGSGVGATASTLVTPTTVGPNVYTVTVTDNNGCGPVTTTVTVTMTPQLSVTASADQVICPGAAASISAIGSGGNGGPYTYTWSNSVSPGTLLGSDQTVIPTTGNTTYTITLTDGCGTPAVTDALIINWFALPAVQYAITNNQGCTPVVVDFANGTLNGPTATVTWNFGDGGIASGDSVTHTFTAEGCYDISLNIITSDGCAVDTTIIGQICVFAFPTPDFVWQPQPTDVFNPEVTFTNLTIGGDMYSWDFAGLGTSNSTNPSFTFPSSSGGTYSVCLTANTTQNCSVMVCHDITINDHFLLYVPNTFTPDGDGTNDVFLPILQGEDPTSFEFYIFNRWGEIIFQSRDKLIGWDGQHNNTKSKEDVYVWKVKVKKSLNEEVVEKTGNVNLIR